MTMKLDPVLAEIRAVREAYAQRFAGDIQGMLADLRKCQRQGGRQVIARSAKCVAIAPKSASN